VQAPGQEEARGHQELPQRARVRGSGRRADDKSDLPAALSRGKLCIYIAFIDGIHILPFVFFSDSAQNLYAVDNADKEKGADGIDKKTKEAQLALNPGPAAAPAGNHILTEEELAALENPPSNPFSTPIAASTAPAAPRAVEEAEMKADDSGAPDSFASYAEAAPRARPGRSSVTAVPVRDEDVEIGKGGRMSIIAGPGGGEEDGPVHTVDENEAVVVQAVSAVPFSAALPMVASVDPAAGSIAQTNANKVRQFHPACAAAAQAEVKLAMSTIFHTFYRNIEVPNRLWDGNGTCKVQLLRSIGKWSTGTNAEISIQNCYIDTINNAKHFIYIENQFFIGNTAGEGVSNGIAAALVNRILMAHTAGEAFRVVIIIPVHPNGDFASAKKAQVVMHYEYATINRGLTSMFEQLRRRAPNITISNYIGFFSLRNWGVINNKVVSDQVYVHDKVMIVDDRVVIIGSANINDRSMLGERDSELAIRVEDTLHCNTTMNGQPFVVGYMPHTLRMKLMRQHLGEDESYGTTHLTLPSFVLFPVLSFLTALLTFSVHNFSETDLSDPLAKSVRDAWKLRSNTNSAVYDQIDGGISVYRCTTVGQFKDAFANYVNPSYLDPQIKHTMAEVKGFLVDWPHTLFEREDLSPNLALRTLIPNALWV
jgi:phosphatidylserine/phosphatidylglycerophosphate/cardiolipin synthase-like enzyme